MTIEALLLIVALILFIVAAIPRTSSGSLIPAGLALVTASLLLPLV